MNTHLLDLIYEGIASGSCPIADDDDLRELLASLEALARKDAMTNSQPPTPPHAPPPEPTPEPITRAADRCAAAAQARRDADAEAARLR